jgi:hypothetical protein
MEPRSTLTIVVPCFGEEDVLPEAAHRLDLRLGQFVKAGPADRDRAGPQAAESP